MARVVLILSLIVLYASCKKDNTQPAAKSGPNPPQQDMDSLHGWFRADRGFSQLGSKVITNPLTHKNGLSEVAHAALYDTTQPYFLYGGYPLYAGDIFMNGVKMHFQNHVLNNPTDTGDYILYGENSPIKPIITQQIHWQINGSQHIGGFNATVAMGYPTLSLVKCSDTLDFNKDFTFEIDTISNLDTAYAHFENFKGVSIKAAHSKYTISKNNFVVPDTSNGQLSTLYIFAFKDTVQIINNKKFFFRNTTFRAVRLYPKF